MSFRKIVFILFAVNIIVSCFAGSPVEIDALKNVFDRYKVTGSILLYDQNKNEYMGYNLDRCNVPFSPASTFKIANALIALESGVVSMDTVFQWKGEKRSMPAWEKDMNLAEAFEMSCVPVYQEVARRVGAERMKDYIRLLNYGNMDISQDNIDKFWLEGNSCITQYQQIYFLQGLYNLRLPVGKQSMQQVKQIMLHEKTDAYRLSGKTGWAVRQDRNITWFVGYVEKGDNVCFFATNIEANADTDISTFGEVRIALTKSVLKELKMID